ncbi:esterase FE4 [Fopius arisanus]|uniref:Carboxylic ester hydrolase n=1 Tax=Fopius arisanus TaxID=64838 RepID=A0A0C9Q3X4_9HYME|nr:PREDICTED: esterase FE4-like [Fopius arisanus]
MWLVRVIVSCLALGLSWAADEVELTIPQGTLRGLKTTTTQNGVQYYSFKGIPYAKPMIGPNKFKQSEPAEGWTGVRDATQHGNTCVFFCMVQQKVLGDDDCLFLNVYTPTLEEGSGKAVMVYFHPGGFTKGSGDDDLFGPDFLLEKDVILVTVNSRLGALGYLNTGDANAPGNAGLKDQVLALNWIQNNIGRFGGCRNRVTLFGVSSGAASVQYHMLSPMSEGLFRRAIIQSGSVSSSWAISYTPREDAMTLAAKLGIKASDTKELVVKLSEVPTPQIVEANDALGGTMNFLRGDMHFMLPSVENNIGKDMFLPADPWELLKSGKVANVHTMIGTVSQEGGLFTGMVLPMVSHFQDNFALFIPKDLNMTDPGQLKMVGESIKKFYFGDKAVGDSVTELTNLLTDVFFACGSMLTARVINARLSSPVYQYLFDFEAPLGFMKSLFKLEKGVVHGDDMTYLFYSKVFQNKLQPGSRVETKTNQMVEMWTDFAKEGNPSITMSAANIKWEPMGEDGKYLAINDELTMKTSIFKDRMNFWAGIYKDVLGDHAKLFN